MHKQLLGIDWGTSNRRAYLAGRDGKCLARHADDQGLLAVGGNFAASLASLRARMEVAPDVPVVMSGMVGSASGWQEVPYLDTSVPLTGLPSRLAPVRGHPGCFIVPGYCARDGAVDVMRGEETQLLGAVGRGLLDGWVVLPGTHSKWVYLRGGKVDQLVTYMTGELFSMLAAGGTLAALMACGLDDESAFGAGLQEARRARPLSNALFGVRARVVSNSMAAAQARSFVSGLLIGAEFVAAQGHADGAIDIIGSPALSARYEEAALHFGMPARVHDPDEVYLAALAYFFESL
ncbi:2-dehydro-3-deoxygalactonokinase [Massilia atriviolacea]|uniref:2-dehydro-3-deoxygalactonokinase n=1 Tax=Massilia atriviolacea TaxID=2495579 RepID=A0A430HR42_9BURK|nr:2-dehydro-3-deoxygalactonokinase [Massilia atriviolacea]RSZ59987.1 2-dehydro-3-deoxygalactonokinase [Massilia atriviolacea]